MIVNFPILIDDGKGKPPTKYFPLDLDSFELKTSTWSGRQYLKLKNGYGEVAWWIPDHFSIISSMEQLKIRCDLENPYDI